MNTFLTQKKKTSQNYMLDWTLPYLEEVSHIKSSFKYINYGI